MKRILFATVVLVACWNVSVLAQNAAPTTAPNMDSYIESLRADFRADKVALITDAMQFNDRESKAFWPVYRRYEADLTKVNDERLALIKSYANKFSTMTDADAKTMINQTIDFESRRDDVKKKYVKEFEKAGISPLTLAKFLQLEHRLDLLVDLEIASELPLILNKPAQQTSSQQ